jgi:hypothetical protein
MEVVMAIKLDINKLFTPTPSTSTTITESTIETKKEEAPKEPEKKKK